MGGQIAGYHRAGPHHAAIADRDAAEHRDTGSEPDITADAARL
jgi:hypothetical protein